jgi:NAD+ synthase (glutamine-hydrolysing)
LVPIAMHQQFRAGQMPQNDEDDMGISYADLSLFGRLRKINRCGPVSLFHAATRLWHTHMPAAEVAQRVKFFFRYDTHSPCPVLFVVRFPSYFGSGSLHIVSSLCVALLLLPGCLTACIAWLGSHIKDGEGSCRQYAINRHKATTITPAYHAESYSPDDNRFDHRPFLYNVNWPWQFARIDQSVERLKAVHGAN